MLSVLTRLTWPLQSAAQREHHVAMGSHVVRVVDTVVGTMVVAVVVIRAIAKVEVGSKRVHMGVHVVVVCVGINSLNSTITLTRAQLLWCLERLKMLYVISVANLVT